MTANVIMASNPNNYTFYGATPAEIAKLSGIGSTTLSTQLSTKLDLSTGSTITGNVVCSGTLYSSTAPYVINSVSALRALSITTLTFTQVWLSGYYTAGDMWIMGDYCCFHFHL